MTTSLHPAVPTQRTRRAALRRRIVPLAGALLLSFPALCSPAVAQAAPGSSTSRAAAAVVPVTGTADAVPVGGVPGVPVPSVTWAEDGDGYQRAQIPVPYDYAQPAGRTLTLNAVRLPARDQAAKLGVLFVNFGGPGGSAADAVRAIGTTLFAQEVLDRYDLVGVDPPGTGQSSPVRCFATTAEQLSLPLAGLADFAEPGSLRELAAASSQARLYARSCATRNDDLLDHVGTLRFARDLDVLRAALGDTRINLYGLSYGTFLGQVVANLFPQRTGALVLDGVVDPAWATGPGVSWTRENGDVGSAQTLREFFTRCDAAGPQACAFAGRSAARFALLAARLRVAPIALSFEGVATTADYSVVIANTTSLLYSPADWPLLGTLLQALYAAATPSGSRPSAREATGVGRALAAARTALRGTAAADEPAYDNYPDANLAITCGDTDNPRRAVSYSAVGLARDATVAPYFGSRWAQIALPCAYWQGRATERWTGPWDTRTANPVLVIGNTRDPATPYANAVKVAGLLPNSALVTLDGVGHTALGTSRCVSTITSTYLLTGATPPAGTRCAQDRGPFDPAPATATPPAAARVVARLVR